MRNFIYCSFSKVCIPIESISGIYVKLIYPGYAVLIRLVDEQEIPLTQNTLEKKEAIEFLEEMLVKLDNKNLINMLIV